MSWRAKPACHQQFQHREMERLPSLVSRSCGGVLVHVQLWDSLDMRRAEHFYPVVPSRGRFCASILIGDGYMQEDFKVLRGTRKPD